jgi:hypothetical protein
MRVLLCPASGIRDVGSYAGALKVVRRSRRGSTKPVKAATEARRTSR